ncbi:coiled-coil domain-containing protein 39-like [Ostrinia nubilalis]|uniref:coiled-coil domain-containing protein 39-like n=1 Tax=Ostrinia nubilalis TaxID=29057 RepID=UPI0030824746
MSEQANVPRYMAQLLEELGWNQGTRIPLANPDNQNLETLLISRQNEIQRLKEALILQNQKCDDLKKYKDHVHTEYQENTRLLFAHKQQLEQEVKLRQLSCNEADRLDRDVIDCAKQSKDINLRIDRLQTNIARLLKKADSLKGEVCGERGALQEWRAALERSAGDISAIEQFTKQDLSKAKALETKRQKLKLEHDRIHDRLAQLVSNLSAEERACERISIQVMEGMDQRKQMMTMWTSAVENLRQRDTDIRHIREDYAVLEAEANNIAEQCREQQAFCDQQRGNNLDAERENMGMMQRLSQMRLAYQEITDLNTSLDSEDMGMMQRLSQMRLAYQEITDLNTSLDSEDMGMMQRLSQMRLAYQEITDLNTSLDSEDMGMMQRLSQMRLAYQEITDLNTSLDSEDMGMMQRLSQMRLAYQEITDLNTSLDSEDMGMMQRLSQMRLAYQEITDLNTSLDSEVSAMYTLLRPLKDHNITAREHGHDAAPQPRLAYQEITDLNTSLDSEDMGMMQRLSQMRLAYQEITDLNTSLDSEDMGMMQRLSQMRLAYQEITDLNTSLDSEDMGMMQRLSQMRLAYQEITDLNTSLDSEVSAMCTLLRPLKDHNTTARGHGHDAAPQPDAPRLPGDNRVPS